MCDTDALDTLELVDNVDTTDPLNLLDMVPKGIKGIMKNHEPLRCATGIIVDYPAKWEGVRHDGRIV